MGLQQDTYSKGDWVVHAQYGVGQVKGKEKKILEGDKQAFFKVKTFNSVYWVSLANTNANYIRPLASKYQIKYAPTLIRRRPKKLPKDYKRRKKEIIRAFNDVSLYSTARMIRDLHSKGKTTKLNFFEMEALKKFKNQFLNEWSLVKKGEDHETLKKRLYKALETGIGKNKLKKSTHG